MNLLKRLTGYTAEVPATKRSGVISLYQTWQDGPESIPNDFVTYVREGYKDNGVVFGVILARMLLFSEASFVFRKRDTKDLVDGGRTLALLEKPWRNGTTGELLARMEQDVSLAGNAYVRSLGTHLQRLRPDWVDIVTDGEQVIGYIYWPEGRLSKKNIALLPDEVAHWSPVPDPEAVVRGMSWLTPVARDVDSDTKMTRHKGKFFDNAATPNLLIKVEGKLETDARERIEGALKAKHESWENAYKTLLLEGGADATVVGSSFEEMSFTVTQAAGENRIASAAGVPGIIAGLKEGLDAATYSNYGQAMKRFVDLTMRPLWRSAAASLETLVTVPRDSQLWYDDRDIPALKQDEEARAGITHKRSVSADLLIRAGYEPETVTVAVDTDDFSVLKHTGAIPTTLYPEGKGPQPSKTDV